MFKHFAVTVALAAALAAPAVALAQTTTAGSASSHPGEPTIAQIYQAAESGNTAEADRLMAQVLKDHPDSAKAHYVHAELLSKEGKVGASKAEFDRANQLAPGLPFAKPEAVAELRNRIEGTPAARRGDAASTATTTERAPSAAPYVAAPAAAAGQTSSSGMSPGKIGLGVLVLAALFFMFRRLTGGQRANGASMAGPQGPYGQPGVPSYGGGPTGYAPGAGAPMSAPGATSGLGGALMTGAAVGLGAVAVEEAVRHFSHRDEPRVIDDGRARDLDNRSFGSLLGADPNADMGGNDFGISDAGSWDSGGSDDSGGGSDWN